MQFDSFFTSEAKIWDLLSQDGLVSFGQINDKQVPSTKMPTFNYFHKIEEEIECFSE
jgi:hypothetical protein